MFWQSVLGGFGVLIHWQVWIALAAYNAAQIGWLIGVGFLIGNSNSGGRQMAGCLTHMIGGSVIQAILLGGIVLFLTPIMLGGNQAMPLQFFVTLAWPIIKACLIALVISFLITLLPIVGGLIANTPGFGDFIQGIIIFRLFSITFIEVYLERAGLSTANLYPGLWQSIGYFVIALIFTYACLFGFAALGTTLTRNKFSGEGTPSFFVGMVLIRLFSIIPLFMYANYVALQIRSMAVL